MTHPQTPPGTKALYMVSVGRWPNRTDLHSVASIKEGHDWIAAQPKQRPRGHFTVNRAVLVRLGDRWHRVSVNPVDKKLIPRSWRNHEVERPKPIEAPALLPAPVEIKVPVPRKFSFKERLRILFTGQL